MPIRVHVPGHGLVEFPDNTSEDVMRGAIDQLMGSGYTPQNTLTEGRKSAQIENDTPSGEKEPDTWWGGFTRGLRREFVDPLTGNAKTQPDTAEHTAQGMAQGMAHPKDVGDMMSLLLPTGVPAAASDAVGGMKILGRASTNAMRDAREIGAARGTSSIREIPKQLLNRVSEEWHRPSFAGPEGTDLLKAKDEIDYPTRGASLEMPEGDPEGWRRDIPKGPLESTPPDLESHLVQQLVEHDPGALAGKAQDLRKQSGARAAARQLFGNGGASAQDAIRTMAPGPSQLPTDALERIAGTRRLAAQGVDGMSPEDIKALLDSIERE